MSRRRNRGALSGALPVLPMPVRLVPLLLVLTILACSARASAYPQLTFKGYGTCADCHHSPTGGGLPNSWGRSSLDVSSSFGTSDWAAQELPYDPAAPVVPRVDLGLDVRLLPLLAGDGDATIGPTLIPMLMELGGAVALSRLTLYATLTPRKQAGSGAPVTPFSREHWLGVTVARGLGVRAGRLVLPFGLRQPDHTQYVREDFGFDKYDQSYALELDVQLEGWSLFGAGFAGDLRLPPELQERGAALTVSREWSAGGALGVSLLGSSSTARDRLAGSLFARVPLPGAAYALAEVATQQLRARATQARFSLLAEYLRLGWFVRPELDLYVELGHRAPLEGNLLSKTRAGLGASWQVFQWFELIPQLLVEARSGLPPRTTGMAQLHFIY